MTEELQHYESQQSLPVATRPDRLSIRDLQEQVALIGEMMKSVLKDDVHYGVIPGVKKKFLLKAGAEKLSTVFRLSPSYVVTRNDLEGGHREYEVRCAMTHIPTDVVWGEGVGNCSTMEKKYRYRSDWVQGVKVTEENKDLADSYNTVLKMAKKRAHVDATLSATACSDFFTQDEDYVVSQSKTPAPRPTITPPQRKEAIIDIPLGEMPSGAVIEHDEEVFDGKEVPAVPAYAKDKQRKLFYAICKGKGMSDDDIKAYLGGWDVASSWKIPADKINEIINDLKSLNSEST